MPGGGGWGEGRVVAFPRFLVCVFFRVLLKGDFATGKATNDINFPSRGTSGDLIRMRTDQSHGGTEQMLGPFLSPRTR